MKIKDLFDSDRVQALSDGVFATMLTVLVLELKTPIAGSETLADALRDSLPKLEAWVVSFIVIGVFWIIHHNTLSVIPRTNTVFNYLNLLVLMSISTIPWLASLLGTYTDDPGATVLFSGVIGLAGLMMAAQWLYASGRAKLTSDAVDATARRTTTLLFLRVPLIALLSMALAFVNRWLALQVWVLCAVLGAIIRSQRHHVPTDPVTNPADLVVLDHVQAPAQASDSASGLVTSTTKSDD